MALHFWMGDVHHWSRTPVSEMTYTVLSGTLNSTIPYHTIPCRLYCACLHSHGKVFNGDILVLYHQDPPGKWLIKGEREGEPVIDTTNVYQVRSAIFRMYVLLRCRTVFTVYVTVSTAPKEKADVKMSKNKKKKMKKKLKKQQQLLEQQRLQMEELQKEQICSVCQSLHESSTA